MEEYKNQEKAKEYFRKLGSESKNRVLLDLMHEETIDLALAMSLYAHHLQKFKRDAKDDMRKLSEAGLYLAASTIKNIPKIKTKSSRQLAIAQTHSLLSAGGFYQTPFTEKLAKSADLSEVDKDWYEQSWKLKRPNVKEDAS